MAAKQSPGAVGTIAAPSRRPVAGADRKPAGSATAASAEGFGASVDKARHAAALRQGKTESPPVPDDVAPALIQSDARVVNEARARFDEAATTGANVFDRVRQLGQAEEAANSNVGQVFETLTRRQLLPSAKSFDDAAEATKTWARGDNPVAGPTPFDQLVDARKTKAETDLSARNGIATEDQLIDNLRLSASATTKKAAETTNDFISDSVARNLTDNLGRATDRDPITGAIVELGMALEIKAPTPSDTERRGIDQVGDLMASLRARDPTLDLKAVQEGLNRWRLSTSW